MIHKHSNCLKKLKILNFPYKNFSILKDITSKMNLNKQMFDRSLLLQENMKKNQRDVRDFERVSQKIK